MLLLSEEAYRQSKALKELLQKREKSARAAKLIYVSDRDEGITRVKRGKTFVYYFKKKKIENEAQLKRIKRLVIPPAWKQVWICRLENGHLQATGLDTKKRKQYKYHSQWSTLRNHTKFHRLYDFGKVMPSVREQLEKDLSSKELSLNKVLATVVCLMEKTSIRVGNSLYEKLYGSFGITTLKDKHVTINGSSIRFVFKGKKGISHNITINNKRLAAIVKQCRDIPGKELFQFIDEHGEHRPIDSGMVNNYLKNLCKADFTAKDLRTWTGTVQALLAFKNLEHTGTQTGVQKNIVAALDCVAKHLGNTRTVCKKYYVHPVIIDLYESGRLHKYVSELCKPCKCEKYELAPEEKVLMKILKKEAAKMSA